MSSIKKLQSFFSSLWDEKSDIENHLIVLTDALSGSSTASDKEIQGSLEHLHVEQTNFVRYIIPLIMNLNFRIRGLLDEDENNGAKSLFYFIEEDQIQESRINIIKLIKFAVTYLLVCSYSTPKQKFDHLSEEEDVMKKKVSNGSQSKRNYSNFFEIVPVYEDDIINRNLIDQSEFEIFQSVFKSYIEEVHEVVSSSTFKMKSLFDKYLVPIERALMQAPDLESKDLTYTEECVTEKDIEIVLITSAGWIMKFLSEQFLINRVHIEENNNLLLRDETRNHIISFETDINFIKMDYYNCCISSKAAFQTKIIGSKELFHQESKNLPDSEQEKINESVVQVIVTLFPIEIKKELYKTKTLIDNEFPGHEIAVGLNKEFPDAQLQDILRSGLMYLIESSEVLLDTCVYLFVHRAALHVGKLSIDFGKLTFIDHPKVDGRKLVKLQNSGTKKIIPVTFSKYPLEALYIKEIDSEKSLRTQGMVKLISWIRSLSENIKSVEKMKEVHLKMSALRDAMQKDSPEVRTKSRYQKRR